MSAPFVIVYGNCQALVINGMSSAIFGERFRFTYVPSAPSIGEAALSDEAAASCEILLEQVGVEQSFPFLDRLNPHVRRIRFPPLGLVALWPFTCRDPRNRREPPEFPFGRYPYGDRVALQVWRRGARGRAAVAEYTEASIGAMPDVNRLLAMEFGRASLIEADCEVKINDYLKINFRSQRLFYSHNHPTPEFIHLLLCKIWEAALPEKWDELQPLLQQHRRHFLSQRKRPRPFEDIQQPIHPRVARTLGLEWWHADLRYFLKPVGRTVSHDEYLEWYLTERDDMPEPQAQAQAPAVAAKATLAPVFSHLNEAFAVETPALRHGVPLLRGCVVANPDGTGFGGGSLEVRLLAPLAGDQLRLRPTDALAVDGDEVSVGGRLAACRLPGSSVAADTEILLRFESQTYFDTLKSILAGIELHSLRPVAGDREITIAISDADGDRTEKRLAVLVAAPAAPDPAALFSVLPPVEKRAAVRRMIAGLLPGAFNPRFSPSDAEFSSHGAFREYAAFELEGLWNARSRALMVEMAPLMYPYLARLSGGKRVLRCLEVDGGTGAGAALLADIFQSSFAGMRIEVETISLDDTFRDYQVARWPNLQRVIIGDPLDLADGSYDIVLSHHLEQAGEPEAFLRKLARIARDYAFIYSPHGAADPVTGSQPLSDTAVDRLEPLERRAVPSWSWRPEGPALLQERVFCVIAGVGGTPPG